MGRWFVDSALIADAHKKKYFIYDLTGLYSLHQGFESSKLIFKGVEEDFEYNRRLLQQRKEARDIYLTANYWVCHYECLLQTDCGRCGRTWN